MAFIKGDPWILCETCGGQERFSVMRKGVSIKQKGFNVCPLCYDLPNKSDKPKFSNRSEHTIYKVK